MKTLLLSAAVLAAAAVPGISFAATYAYVNTSGEVMTTEAATPNSAIATAPNISLHSGVMLVNSTSDPVVGDGVSGI